jgi:hypothetical protein
MTNNLPALSPKKAIENIAKQFPGEAEVLTAVIKANIAVLGTDEVFSLRDKDGDIRCFKQNLTLSEKDGTLIQPVPGGDFAISAQGYEQWASASGACAIFPSEVLVDGKWQQNPFVQRDATNRRILAIYARAIAFRFSDKGLPQVSYWTTIFDTPSYRMIDLLSKAKKLPQAFRLLPEGMEPSDDGTWAKYPFDESTTLWVNTAHNEALSWFSQILNREKKAIDFAQTFAKRNALKHLSGLQKAPGNVWTIPVLCWRPTGGNIIKWDATQYATLQNKVGKMISGDKTEFKQIDIKAGAERTSDAIEETEGLIEHTDVEDQQPAEEVKSEISDQKKEAKQEKKKLTTDEQKIMKTLSVIGSQFPEEFRSACKEVGIVIENITPDDALKIIEAVNKLLEG